MKYFLSLILLVSYARADVFSDLVAKTSSVFSGVADVDASNPHNMGFETLLTNQKVFLNLSVTHLNSSFYTIVNSDSSKNKKKLTPPEININNLQLSLDGSTSPTASCDGGDVSESDTSCTSKECNPTQRIISQCNDSNCWDVNPSTDRLLVSPLSEKFWLSSRVDISDCIPSNVAGEKHVFGMTIQNTSSSVLNGGSIHYALVLVNSVATTVKK